MVLDLYYRPSCNRCRAVIDLLDMKQIPFRLILDNTSADVPYIIHDGREYRTYAAVVNYIKTLL